MLAKRLLDCHDLLLVREELICQLQLPKLICLDHRDPIFFILLIEHLQRLFKVGLDEVEELLLCSAFEVESDRVSVT